MRAPPAPLYSPDHPKTRLTVRFLTAIALAALYGCTPLEFPEGELAVTQVTSGRAGEDRDPEVSPDGKLLYFASSSFGESFDLFVKTIGTNTATRLTSIPGDKRFPRVNPADPRFVAFSTNSRGEWEIALLNTSLAGASVEYVSPRGRQALHPSWSPDGRMVIFCSTEDLAQGEWMLQVYDLDSRKVTSFEDLDGLLPQWSPKGNRILFQRMKHRDGWLGGLWTVDFEGGSARNLTMVFSSDEWAAIHPAWSPDGRRIVFATVGKSPARANVLNEGDDIWASDADGSHATRLTTQPSSEGMPVWSSDGRIYFTSDRTGARRIWSVRPKLLEAGISGF